ncbi:hypothetical protein ACERCG_05660 [Mannheimia sp. E30BD]|uniref:hypothetical protein n=1 Tax=Mannheimia sp. E30BD TaxID=3278708 RepID=UPI00359E6BA3
MNWKEVSKSVGKVAAGIAPLLTGPVGIAFSVGSLIAEALGTDNNPEAIVKALKTDPQAALKLQEMQLKHAEFFEQSRLQQLNIDAEMEKARLADLQQARSTHKGHFMPPLLTLILFLTIAGTIFGLMNFQVPEANQEVVYLLIGSVTTAFTQAFAYWLGSSRGSAEKQAMLVQGKSNARAYPTN